MYTTLIADVIYITCRKRQNIHFTITMNKNPMNTPEALARLQAAAEYAARPHKPPEGNRRSVHAQLKSASYTKALEEFRQ